MLMQLCKYEKNVNFIQKPSGYLSRRLIFMEVYAKLTTVLRQKGAIFYQNEEQISDQKFMCNNFICNGFIQSDVSHGCG